MKLQKERLWVGKLWSRKNLTKKIFCGIIKLEKIESGFFRKGVIFMKKSELELKNEVRALYKEKLMLALGDEDLQDVGSNVFAFPIVDSAGIERWIKVTVVVPAGSREDKTGYDGYAEAQDYKFKLEQKAIKAQKKQG